MTFSYLRLHQAVHKVMATKKHAKKHHQKQQQKHQEVYEQICCEQLNITAFTQKDTVEFTFGKKRRNSLSMVLLNESTPQSCRSTSFSDYSVDASSVLPPLTLQSSLQESVGLQETLLADNCSDIFQLNPIAPKVSVQSLPPIHELDLSPLAETVSSPIPIPFIHPSHTYYHQEELLPGVQSLHQWNRGLEVQCQFSLPVEQTKCQNLSTHPVLSDDNSDTELVQILKASYGADADRMAESLKFLAMTLRSQGNTLIERLVIDSPDQPQSRHHYLHNDILFGKTDCHCMRIVNVLGCGSFGIVLRCRLLETNQEVALKIIDKRLIHFSQYTNRGHLSEVAVMQELTDESDSDLGIPRVLEAWEDDFAWYVMMEYGGYPWAVSLKESNVNDMQKRLEIKADLVEAAVVARSVTPVMKQLASISLGRVPGRVALNQITQDWIDATACIQRKVHRDVPQVLAIPLAPVDHHLGALIRILGGYENADRSSYIPSRHPIIPLEAQLVIIRSVLVALNRLHSNGLCHRDVKCENVLVDRELSHIQLIDFGHAANYRCAETPNAPIFTQYGTHLFNPPEVRWPNYRPSGKLSYQSGRYRGPEADVYALGLMCYEMTYGDLPPELFRVPKYPQVDANGTVHGGNTSFWDIGGIQLGADRGFSNHAYAILVRSMLLVDPRQRPCVGALLEKVDDVARNIAAVKNSVIPSSLV